MPCWKNLPLAKEGALAKNDTKTIDSVNEVIDSYYNKFIKEELEMVDPEENDYTYVIEACENALGANPENPRALYHLALVNNKMIEYDAAIEYALKAFSLKRNLFGFLPSILNWELPIRIRLNMIKHVKPSESS